MLKRRETEHAELQMSLINCCNDFELLIIYNFLSWRNPPEGRSQKYFQKCTKTHLRQLKIEPLGKEKGKEAGRIEEEGKWDNDRVE